MISLEQFIDKTAILPSIVVLRCAEGHNLPENRLRWFHNNVERRLLAMWPRYKRQFCRQSSIDFVYMWVEHWLAAYTLDYDRYESQHGAMV